MKNLVKLMRCPIAFKMFKRFDSKNYVLNVVSKYRSKNSLHKYIFSIFKILTSRSTLVKLLDPCRDIRAMQ